jgi:hypothetical protein
MKDILNDLEDEAEVFNAANGVIEGGLEKVKNDGKAMF